MVAPDLDGLRQPAVRDARRPGRDQFARRDFLSAFITCFLPIIACYYPLMLLGQNMSKENMSVVGLLEPYCWLWVGNLILAVLAGFVLPPVIKH